MPGPFSTSRSRGLTRRTVLGGSLGVALAACGTDERRPAPGDPVASSSGASSAAATGEPTLSTPVLLPYGTTYDIGGQRWTMERAVGPALALVSGEVGFTDPGFLVGERARPAARLQPGELACEMGVLVTEESRFEGQRTRLGSTVAFGPVDRVRAWRAAGVDEPYRFSVDSGMGCCYDAGALDDLAATTEDWEPLVRTVLESLAVPLVVGGRTAAVVFDCGLGDGSYPVFVGEDASGRVIAVAADLELHHQGTPLRR